MLVFLGSLAAPILGASLYGALHPKPSTVRLFDRFVYVAVTLLVAGQVLPGAWTHRSLLPLVAVAAGAILFVVIERTSRWMAGQADNAAIALWILGVALHASLEGAALAPGAGPVESGLAAAVIIHRIAIGLLIRWLIEPQHGKLPVILGIGALVAATAVGGLVGTEALPLREDGRSMLVFQAFIGGSLLHAVFHQGRRHHQHERPLGY